MNRSPRILLAGGGTGGHVYPALAIADAIRRLAPEAVLAFAGTRERLEWSAVPKAGYPIHPITVTGLQRGLDARNLAFPFKLVKGLVQSWQLIGAFDPDVAVGTGGYVSGPVLLAASARGRPVLVQEQNAFAGVTNRLLAKRAARVHIAFPEAERQFPAEKCVLSGNPTRRELLDVDPAEARRAFEIPPDAAVLLVFGGSLGSAALNAALEQHRDALLDRPNTFVLWQTGAAYYDRLAGRVAAHERLKLLKYIDRMDYAYAAADLALCRSGAITCSELMVTGTPSVLVPSPNVAEDHQTKNARSMVQHGAARLLPEANLREGLTGEVGALLDDAEQRRQMAEAAKKMARPDAAERIARDVLGLAGWSEEDRDG